MALRRTTGFVSVVVLSAEGAADVVGTGCLISHLIFFLGLVIFPGGRVSGCVRWIAEWRSGERGRVGSEMGM